MDAKAVAIANSLLKDNKKYQLDVRDKLTRKRMKEVLNQLADDANTMLVTVCSSGWEELSNNINGIKDVAVSKSVTETRVRFWINVMTPLMVKLAKEIVEKEQSEKENAETKSSS
jgi:hypothetical protein